MTPASVGGITVFRFLNLSSDENIRHFVSTRIGGVSPSPFASLNLGLKVEAVSDLSLKNRQVLCDSLGIPLQKLTYAEQIHSGNVVVVDGSHAGSGTLDPQSAVPGADALVTKTPDICISVLVADCLPVLMYDPFRKAIAIVHAGRMGTLARISQKTVEVMCSIFGTNPETLLIGIGPSICVNHYPVSPGAFNLAKSTLGPEVAVKKSDGSLYLDLLMANRAQLTAAGVPEKNIEVSNLCTFENPQLFFSERRDGQPTGRFSAGIMLK